MRTNYTHGGGVISSIRRFGGLLVGLAVIFATLFAGQLGTSDAMAESIPRRQAASASGHFMVYYRAWRDVTMKGVNTTIPDSNWISMYDIPYGIDVVNVFSYVPQGQESLAQPFYDKLKSDYAPYLHARGIKLVRGIDYKNVMVRGFQTYMADQGADVKTATEADYDAYAATVVDTYMTSIGLDGLDIDMEDYPDESQIAISNRVIASLAKLIGPKSSHPQSTMLLYDTNGSNMGPFSGVTDCFNFVAYQQYGSDAQRTASAVGDYEQYIDPSKFVPGLTFPEEGDMNNRWYDATEPYPSSHIYDVASYSSQHHLGGMFLYALDRDGRTYDDEDLKHVRPSNLLWTKTAIAQSQAMTLAQARSAANHFLDRMALVRRAPQEVRQAVNAGSDLYEVNKAVLGADWGKGYSNTYDPTLEVALLGIDISGLVNDISTANERIADSRVSGQARDALHSALNSAIEGLSGKQYTQDEILQWDKVLRHAIDTAAVPPPQSAPDDNRGGSDVASMQRLPASLSATGSTVQAVSAVAVLLMVVAGTMLYSVHRPSR